MSCELLLCQRDTATSSVKFWLQVHLIADGKIYELDSNQPYALTTFGGIGYDQALGDSIVVHLLYVGQQTTQNPDDPIYNPEIYVGSVPDSHSPADPQSPGQTCHIASTLPILRDLDVSYTVDSNPASCQVSKNAPYDRSVCK